MLITKLEHSALLIVHDAETLIIDPGSFTRPVDTDAGAVAVVITHEHADHWTPEQLERIRTASPHVRVFGPAGVVAAAAAAGIAVETVAAGDTVAFGSYTLRFFGGAHAVIHRSIPVVDNVGVLVNGRFYYAGDSFAAPEGVQVEVLAVPAAAPWMKIAEAMDYVEAVAPAQSFATHEMQLSEAGKALSNARIAWSTEQAGGRFTALAPGDTLEF
jgi:L-ascorbate metabolism protein UlaG (beta-lactamase superfamily)